MGKKIFSGVQPTGNLHLGNYLGAIKNFVELNNDTENQCIFCVVDLHAITVKQDPIKLKDNIYETVATFIASGIDPQRSIIFNQSKVSAHSEAAWILSCVGRMGWLNRMTQFKEKAGKDKEKASVGLYSYPILMSADILLYDSTHVPVGDDQKQHLELTRDIAQKFNNDFKNPDFFKIPEPLIKKEFSRIMSLKDGQKKMSKSELSDTSRINLSLKACLPECFPITNEVCFTPTLSGVIISYVFLFLSIPSWWMPDSWANAFFPTIALLYWTGKPVTFDTSFDALLSNVVFIPVSYGIKSFLVLIAITTSSNAALPALSPIPLIVHSICLAPAWTPASEFATAKPKSLWQCVDKIALSMFGTLFNNVFIIVVNSEGTV